MSLTTLFSTLIENGQQMYIWIGKLTSSDTLSKIFGVDKIESIDVKMVGEFFYAFFFFFFFF